jgi:hypothetical protein
MMYLYQAIQQVLQQNNKPMRIEEIADAINQQNSCRKRNGDPVDALGVGFRAVTNVVGDSHPLFDVLIKLR